MKCSPVISVGNRFQYKKKLLHQVFDQKKIFLINQPDRINQLKTIKLGNHSKEDDDDDAIFGWFVNRNKSKLMIKHWLTVTHRVEKSSTSCQLQKIFCQRTHHTPFVVCKLGSKIIWAQWCSNSGWSCVCVCACRWSTKEDKPEKWNLPNEKSVEFFYVIQNMENKWERKYKQSSVLIFTQFANPQVAFRDENSVKQIFARLEIFAHSNNNRVLLAGGHKIRSQQLYRIIGKVWLLARWLVAKEFNLWTDT